MKHKFHFRIPAQTSNICVVNIIKKYPDMLTVIPKHIGEKNYLSVIKALVKAVTNSLLVHLLTDENKLYLPVAVLLVPIGSDLGILL